MRDQQGNREDRNRPREEHRWGKSPETAYEPYIASEPVSSS